MTEKELKFYKEQFDREGYIHENVIKELFEIANNYLVAKTTCKPYEVGPGC